MRTTALALLLLATPMAMAQHRWRPPANCPPVPCPPSAGAVSPYAPLDPNRPLMPPDQAPAAPPADSPFQQALASAGEGGTQSGGSYLPGFFGDLLGGCRVVTVGVFVDGSEPFFRTVDICVPDPAQAGGIKIAEGDSPRPTDRIFYFYNAYTGINVDPTDPTVPPLNINRHLIGFEKTFLRGDASIGLRIPFFSLGGNLSYQTGYTGDLSMILKYARINNRVTGNVLSGGLVLSVPTGGEPDFTDPNGDRFPVPRTFGTIIQPFAGYVYSFRPRLFVQGFHSVAVSTTSELPTFMANDLSVGWWVYRNPMDQLLRGILPMLEVHVNTPFGGRVPPAGNQVQMLDSVNLTMGTYFLFMRSTIGVAGSVPLAFGPHRFEWLVNCTLRF